MAISYTSKGRCPNKSRTVKKFASGARKCASGVSSASVTETTAKRCKNGTRTIAKRKRPDGKTARTCGTLK